MIDLTSISRFLLAHLHLGSLIGKRSPRAVKAALQQLQSGSEAIDIAYQEAMQRIQGLVPDQRELALQVLSWITCSQRPLSAVELQYALTVEIGETSFDSDNMPDIEDMVSVCAGLVTIDEQTHVIRLVHHTTQEYFERTWQTWFSNAHHDIATACLTYLGYDTFKSGICASDNDLDMRLRTYQLYSYSSLNWGYHARRQPVNTRLFLDFLQNSNKTSACSQVLSIEEKKARVIGWSQRVPNDVFGVHLAAKLGLGQMLNDLIEIGIPYDSADSNNQTPLSWAATNGQEEITRKLLELGVNIKPDKPSFTPLAAAANNGHEAIAQLLLEAGADPNTEDKDSRTPLSWAAKNGHDAVIGLLINYHATIDKEDSNCRTPLLWAARCGHSTTVKLLLESGAEPDPRDKEYQWSALSWACGNGHIKVVKLLLENNASPVSKDIHGSTPLFYAIENENTEVVRLLLGTVVDANTTDINCLASLPVATENDFQTEFTMLMENNLFKRPEQLFYAAHHGESEYAKFLLQIGVDANITTAEKGESALPMAARNGHAGVVRHLLDHGADVDHQDLHYGKTALYMATCAGQGDIVRLLLERDANPRIKNIYGQTPLSFAAWEEIGEVVCLLLNTGADPNSKDIYGRTPLMFAAAIGHEAISSLLLQAGSDINTTDINGRTPLVNAAAGGSLTLVQILLDMKADPARKDKYGRDAEYEANKRGHRNVARALLCSTGGENILLSGAKSSKRSRGQTFCDICFVILPYGSHYFHCKICHGGDFDICQYCEESGASCFMEGHQLYKGIIN